MLLALAQNGVRGLVIESTIMTRVLLPCREASASAQSAEDPVQAAEEMIDLSRFVRISRKHCALAYRIMNA